ncbi:hypothetical protein [Streptomyces sp. NPDC037389]|uniref:hypothetical protein n=1 Tax=Streptomyces sp. NPDC037389 TaxID=3155369 RepID=UPI0033E8CFAD
MTPPESPALMNTAFLEPGADQTPAYVPLGRYLAIAGLACFVPVLGFLVLLMAGMQEGAEACYSHGCADTLAEAISWCWPVLSASAATGIIAALLPNRFAKPRCALAFLQIALMVAPLFVLASAAPGIT